MTPANSVRTHAANRLGLDYASQASRFAAHDFGIIDVHTHLSGGRAVELYRDAARQYGIELTYSMTAPESAESVRRVLGDAVRFIVVPDFAPTDMRYAMTEGYLQRIHEMRKHGARITKFWAAPRGIDFADKAGFREAMRIDSDHYIKAMQLTQDLGMAAMVHVGDPDTWFATKYAKSDRYGTKAEHYERFESVLGRFEMPFIAAHCGGWPENLDFLDGLLGRHDHLHLDLSATKWMVRELSRHDAGRLLQFFSRWSGRLLFGSDVVVSDSHLAVNGDDEMSSKAASEREASDLYASRYWALRTLFETTYSGPSPIADPDLAMVWPEKYSEDDAPQLDGKSLPSEILRSFYRDAAVDLLESIYAN